MVVVLQWLLFIACICASPKATTWKPDTGVLKSLLSTLLCIANIISLIGVFLIKP